MKVRASVGFLNARGEALTPIRQFASPWKIICGPRRAAEQLTKRRFMLIVRR